MTNVMLAHTHKGQDPTNWYMSEKLDGVRAIWTGTEFLSRNNKPIHAPAWFTQYFFKQHILDGELYLGRGKFQQTVSAVKKHVPIDAEWGNIAYCVFDTVKLDRSFESRYTICKEICELLSSHTNIALVQQTRCPDVIGMWDYYQTLVQQGAEGIMLRNPASLYEFRRSKNLLKVKPEIQDKAILVDIALGKGKCAAVAGTFICAWRDKIIHIGTGMTDYQREFPPKRLSTIYFKYPSLTDVGKPRVPVFISAEEPINE